MNIDFHYGVVFYLARLAGLPSPDATKVAHACQYVDDATTHGLLKFKDGQTFDRIASAHELYDFVHNAENEQNRIVWVPFHFLPGLEGQSVEEQAICRPNSAVAQDLMTVTLQASGLDNGLHRLGVGLHTYIDTWAHQGFSGMVSDVNRIVKLVGDDHPEDTWRAKLFAELKKVVNTTEAIAIDQFSGLGHGAALHFPDLPWANWSYTTKSGKIVHRANLPDFLEAADMAFKVISAHFRKSDDFRSQQSMSAQAKASLSALLAKNQNHDANTRLTNFADALKSGALSGVTEHLPDYIAKGPGSWKALATGLTSDDDSGDPPIWTDGFEKSDYRKFHDAVKEQRFEVVQRILPKRGLRLA